MTDAAGDALRTCVAPRSLNADPRCRRLARASHSHTSKQYNRTFVRLQNCEYTSVQSGPVASECPTNVVGALTALDDQSRPWLSAQNPPPPKPAGSAVPVHTSVFPSLIGALDSVRSIGWARVPEVRAAKLGAMTVPSRSAYPPPRRRCGRGPRWWSRLRKPRSPSSSELPLPRARSCNPASGRRSRRPKLGLEEGGREEEARARVTVHPGAESRRPECATGRRDARVAPRVHVHGHVAVRFRREQVRARAASREEAPRADASKSTAPGGGGVHGGLRPPIPSARAFARTIRAREPSSPPRAPACRAGRRRRDEGRRRAHKPTPAPTPMSQASDAVQTGGRSRKTSRARPGSSTSPTSSPACLYDACRTPLRRPAYERPDRHPEHARPRPHERPQDRPHEGAGERAPVVVVRADAPERLELNVGELHVNGERNPSDARRAVDLGAHRIADAREEASAARLFLRRDQGEPFLAKTRAHERIGATRAVGASEAFGKERFHVRFLTPASKATASRRPRARS